MAKRVAGVLGIVALVVGLATAVAAQDPPRPPKESPFAPFQPTEIHVIATGLPIPRNGSIVLKVAAQSLPIVVVSPADDPSTLLGGTLRNVTGVYWTWTATEPLEPGGYVVSMVHPAIEIDTTTIDVIDDVEIDPAVIASFHVFAQAVGEPHYTEYANCYSWRGTDPDFTQAFPVRAAYEVRGYLDLGLIDEPTASQFLYRVFEHEEDDTPFVGANEMLNTLPFTEQAEEYCFHLEAMDVATGAVHAVDRPAYCVQHGSLHDIGEYDVEVSSSVLTRDLCPTPPDGLEEQWCEVNDACAEATDGGHDAAGSDEAASDDIPVATPSRQRSGCSISALHPSSCSYPIAIAWLMIGVFWCRRRA